MKKILILTHEKNPIATDLFAKINGKYNVYVVYNKKRGLWGLDDLSRYLKRKRGLRWLIYDLLFLWAKKYYKIGHTPEESWGSLLHSYKEKFYVIDEHNSFQSADIIRKVNPDLGVLIGTPIIKQEFFNIPKYGMINLHQADLEVIRGAPPAYWEHHNGLTQMCVSVHKVVERLDAGHILNKKCFSIVEDEHLVISKFRANRISVDLLSKSIDEVIEGKEGIKPSMLGELKTVPNFRLLLKEFLLLSWKQLKGFIVRHEHRKAF